MEASEIEIDMSRTRPYEAGAIIFAHLALPNGTEEARGGPIFSLCHLALRARFDPSGPEAGIEQPLKPVYVFRTESEVRTDLRTFDRRIRDRLIAADIAVARLKKATGVLPESRIYVSSCDR